MNIQYEKEKARKGATTDVQAKVLEVPSAAITRPPINMQHYQQTRGTPPNEYRRAREERGTRGPVYEGVQVKKIGRQ